MSRRIDTSIPGDLDLRAEEFKALTPEGNVEIPGAPSLDADCGVPDREAWASSVENVAPVDGSGLHPQENPSETVRQGPSLRQAAELSKAKGPSVVKRVKALGSRAVALWQNLSPRQKMGIACAAVAAFAMVELLSTGHGGLSTAATGQHEVLSQGASSSALLASVGPVGASVGMAPNSSQGFDMARKWLRRCSYLGVALILIAVVGRLVWPAVNSGRKHIVMTPKEIAQEEAFHKEKGHEPAPLAKEIDLNGEDKARGAAQAESKKDEGFKDYEPLPGTRVLSATELDKRLGTMSPMTLTFEIAKALKDLKDPDNPDQRTKDLVQEAASRDYFAKDLRTGVEDLRVQIEAEYGTERASRLDRVVNAMSTEDSSASMGEQELASALGTELQKAVQSGSSDPQSYNMSPRVRSLAEEILKRSMKDNIIPDARQAIGEQCKDPRVLRLFDKIFQLEAKKSNAE